MLELEVIEDPAVAAVALDPLRARMLAELRGPPRPPRSPSASGSGTRRSTTTCARSRRTASWPSPASAATAGSPSACSSPPRRPTSSPPARSARAPPTPRASPTACPRAASSRWPRGSCARSAGLARRAEAEDRRLATLAIDTEIAFATPEDRARFAAELAERRDPAGGRLPPRRRAAAPPRRRRPSHTAGGGRMSERRVDVEIEVPVAPEEAFEAVATGAGISAWFVRTEVDGRVGGAIVPPPRDRRPLHRGDDRRLRAAAPLAYSEAGWSPRASRTPIPSSRSSSWRRAAAARASCASCRAASAGPRAGRRRSRRSPRAGARRSARCGATSRTSRARPRAPSASARRRARRARSIWEQLTEALGLPADAAVGDRVSARLPGGQALAGTLEDAAPRSYTILLDEPGRGIGYVGVGGPGEATFVFVRAQLFGPDAPALAERAQADWAAWLESRPVAALA